MENIGDSIENVDINYSKKSIHRKSGLRILRIILGVWLFLVSLIIFSWFWIGLLLLTIGILVFPKSSEWIERKLQFKITGKIRLCVTIPLAILCLILANKYSEREIKNRQMAEQKRIEQAEASEDSIRLQNQCKDSIVFYISEAEQLTKNKKYQSAIVVYNKILNLSPENQEHIQLLIADLHYQSKEYDTAILKYKELEQYSFGDTLNYQIALCYIGLSDKATAVLYLRQAINQNSERANELYNKINPIKKRLIGYTTLCCDGTTTSNRGRGACSKHGGVCNRNYPVYDEYRQY
jgi:tetratricopeptide (TPR) repeat protein